MVVFARNVICLEHDIENPRPPRSNELFTPITGLGHLPDLVLAERPRST